MTDEAAMRAAVVAAPDDDTARLVFADWLDDHGHPEWAAYIRAQIDYACRFNNPHHGCPTPATPMNEVPSSDGLTRRFEPGTPLPCGACPTCEEMAALAAELNRLWNIGTDAGGFLETPACWGRCDWKRGFIDALDQITFEEWEANAAVIRAAHPVRRVRLTTPPPPDVMTRRGSTIDDVLAERPRVIDSWHESDRWPGVRFDLPAGRLSMAEFYMRYVADQVDQAERARNLLAQARFPRVDFRPMMAAFEQTARVFQDFSEAVTAAAIPAVRQLLDPLARSAATLQPVTTRADRRKARRRR